MGSFQLPWIIPPEEHKLRTIRGRLVDRLFGIEYTKFEIQKIQEFDKARKVPLVEITGFVSWIDRKRFLLLPTKTTNCIWFICEAIEDVNFPPNNQYISIKGKWSVRSDKSQNSFYKVLVVEDIQLTIDDIGIIKPDISQKDFEGHLFDGWSNLDGITKNFLAQNYVSSPAQPSRTGGFTISLFNHPRIRKMVNLLHSDIKRSIAPELLGTKPSIFEILELHQKHRLPSFSWKETVSNFEGYDDTVGKLMKRNPTHAGLEHSISLLSQKQTPKTLESEGLVKSDFPIVIEDHVERKRHPISTDLQITSFIIATHMNAPSIDIRNHDEGIRQFRSKLEKFVDTKDYLAKNILGHEQLFDLGQSGKPSSIINMTLSRGRSQSIESVSIDDINKASNDFIANMDTTFRIWEDNLAYGKIHPSSTLSYEEEKILVLLHSKGPHNEVEICKILNISRDDCIRIIRSLTRKNTIFQYDQERYGAV